jgi:chaperonin GroES
MSQSKFKPLADRVIIEPTEAEQKTKSGILIPDSAQEKPQIGKVVRIGTGRVTEDGKTVPMEVKEGDIVIYAKYGGTDLKEDGNELIILKESDILAIQEA